MKVNHILDYEISSGKINMQKDLEMLENTIKTGNWTLRLYGWMPKCVSLGKNQKDFTPRVEIDVIRRPTGGRALLHDDELTYCITGKIPKNQSVIETYKYISQILINGFLNLNLPLEIAKSKNGAGNYCMNISSGADICYKNKKLIGSAQFRKQGCFLQHGSILKSADFSYFKKVFNEEIDESKIITLKQIAPDIKDEDLINSLYQEFYKAMPALF